MHYITNIFIGKWCTFAIITICYGPEQLHIVFISWGCHAGLFACCVKVVQDIPSIFKYVKIAWLLDNWIIRN